MKLSNLIKTNILNSILIVSLIVIYGCGTAFSSYVIKFAYNSLSKSHFFQFLYFILVSLITGLVAFIINSVATWLYSRQLQQYIGLIRKKLVKHYFHSESDSTGAMINNLNNNLQLLTDQYGNQVLRILSSIFVMDTSTIALVMFHWSIAVLVICLVFVTLLIPKLTRKAANKATRKISEQNKKYLNTIFQWFNGLAELRRYLAFDAFNHYLTKKGADLEQTYVDRQKVMGLAQFINGCANSFSQVAVTFLATILFFAKIVSFGTIIAAGTFASSIFNAALTITTALTRMQSTKNINQQLNKLQREIPVEYSNETNFSTIKTRSLKYKYPNNREISYPDITIRRGEKILLQGRSGSGKSTLFKLLLGKLKPTSGQICFCDKKGNKVKVSCSQISYLAQDNFLFPASIKENITMFNSKLDKAVERYVKSVQLESDLAAFPAGLETLADVDKNNLSGGQRQKIVLARNEIQNKPVILADESTSAIDENATNKIISNLLNSDQTIIVIAHNLTKDTKKLFDRVINIDPNRGEANYDV